MNRVEVLTEIADRYRELVEPGGRNGALGSGDSIPVPPTTYTPTVREFERLLVELRDTRHSVWWHVMQYHVDADRVNAWHCPRCKAYGHAQQHTHTGKSGRPLIVTCVRKVHVRRHHNADRAKARKGLEWIAENWALRTEPMLPTELMVAA